MRLRSRASARVCGKAVLRRAPSASSTGMDPPPPAAGRIPIRPPASAQDVRQHSRARARHGPADSLEDGDDTQVSGPRLRHRRRRNRQCGLDRFSGGSRRCRQTPADRAASPGSGRFAAQWIRRREVLQPRRHRRKSTSFRRTARPRTCKSRARSRFIQSPGPPRSRFISSTGNLREFDRVLTDLGLAANGKRGVAAIPVQLQGQAEFTGLVTGSLDRSRCEGSSDCDQFYDCVQRSQPRLPYSRYGHTARLWLRRKCQRPSPPPVVAEHSLGPAGCLRRVFLRADCHSACDLAGNGATIEAQGQLEAHRIGPRKSTFDDSSPLDPTS